MQFVKRNYLPITVFMTGAGVLIIEVVAVRILAPYFGNTIFTVSSVLTVVLAALSLGYYLGGRLADKRPHVTLFFNLILLGGLSVVVLHWMRVLFLPSLGNMLPLTTGPLITSVLLFFVPSWLLGMLSPFAIKLAEVQRKGQGVGSIVGTIFFFSTMGSIAGSLLAGYVLVPRFGVGAIILGVGVGLTLLALVPLAVLGMERRTVVKVSVLLVAMLAVYGLATPQSSALYDKNGVYERIVVTDSTYDGRPARFLYQDRSASGAMYLDSDDLVYQYTKYYALHELFVPETNRALVLGSGAYSIPKVLLDDLPRAHVDTVDIEPALVGVGERFFKVPEDEPRLTDIIADGRRWLHDTEHGYDLIFSDVYDSLYSIPMHFTTKEFFQLAYDRLNDDGLLVANVIGSLDGRQPSLLLSEVKTIQAVFPNVYVFAVESPESEEVQNFIVAAHKSNQRIELNGQQARQSRHEVVRTLAAHELDLARFNMDRYPILTDDYAPVESWTAELLRRRAR